MALVPDGGSSVQLFEHKRLLAAAIQFDGTEQGALAVLHWLKGFDKVGRYAKKVSVYKDLTFSGLETKYETKMDEDLELFVGIDTTAEPSGVKDYSRVRPSWWLFINYKQDLDMLSDREFKQLYKEKTDD